MVAYGYGTSTKGLIYSEYICDNCGSHLGRIEVVFDDEHTKVHDDIAGWNFCPYCGENLWMKSRK